jgi:hypothetical protein
MRAEETTLAPPDLENHPNPHGNDGVLIERMHEGLRASRCNPSTVSFMVSTLVRFSAWLQQVRKADMRSRLFSEELISDAWKYIRLGGSSTVISAVEHLRKIETSTTGTTDVRRRNLTKTRNASEVDRVFIELAFESAPGSSTSAKADTNRQYKNALLSFSEWLAQAALPPLANSPWLHSEQINALAEQGVSNASKQSLMAALNHLRTFDLQGVANTKRKRDTLNIPEPDQRLIFKYRVRANEALERSAEATGKPVSRDKAGRSKADMYASFLRSFSSWLQTEGRESIAARLFDHDGSLADDLELFDAGRKTARKSGRYLGANRGLWEMRNMFPEATTPELVVARIGAERLVQALTMLWTNASLVEVARSTGAAESDLRVLLDERSESGLTEAGQGVVGWFDGRLRREVESLRARPRGHVAPDAGHVPAQTPSPFHLSPMSPSDFPSFEWSDEPSGHPPHGGSLGSVQRGTDPAYGDLSPLNSAAYSGGHGFHLNTPSEEAAHQARADSAFDDLSSLGSAARYGSHVFDFNTPPAEAAQQARTDSAFDGLSSLGSVANYGGHGRDLNTPSVEAPQQAGTPSEVTGPSQLRQPVPFGPVRGSLRSVLAQLNLERGFASGDALNCLIDTVLQLSTTGVRRPDHGQTPMPGLDQRVPQWRQYLFAAGVVPQHGMIDLYSATRAGQDLAHNLGVRIQIIQWENGRVSAHPVLGQQGRLVHILHTPGHFQPLWPRNG